MLGGNYMQMTATQAAVDEGYYVISVDYLPENPAHKLAHEYHNISTIDKEKVLELAKKLKIDGIVSYASDISATTAAYVAESLNLPTNPYESVNILTHKNLFRKFMKENNFPMPMGESFNDFEEAKRFFKTIKKPAFIKPIDSSGSKGCLKIYDIEEFEKAWEEAMNYSISKNVIIEEFIERKGYQIDGDIFVIDGKIRFWGICDQHQDIKCNKYAPIGLSYPSTQDILIQKKAKEEIEHILSLLNMHMGAYNVEYIVSQDNEVYILEIGPRNGGNYITDAINASTEVNLAKYTVRQAVGDDCDNLIQKPANKCSSSYIVHSLQDGIYNGLVIDSNIEKNIVKKYIEVKPGDTVYKFRNAAYGLGAMVINFENVNDMCYKMDNINHYIQVKLL